MNLLENTENIENIENENNPNRRDETADTANAVNKDDCIDVIGVSFRDSGKIYHFDSNGTRAKDGTKVVVETARGVEYGTVTMSNRMISKTELVLPLKKVLRTATAEDDTHYAENRAKENEAFEACQKKIAEHGLDMKLIDVEYTFDNAKLLFYFTSDDRVDFRELVKDLASLFHTRIELRQIGIRDETKIMGGLGVCYREYCCHSFLSDFTQVSIKMAKEQGLSLNSAKISGACGRLMCCLRFEHETYQEEIRLTPKVGEALVTPDGTGIVVEAKPLLGLVKVKLDADPEGAPKIYDRDAVRAKTDEDETTKRGEKVAREQKPVNVPFVREHFTSSAKEESSLKNDVDESSDTGTEEKNTQTSRPDGRAPEAQRVKKENVRISRNTPNVQTAKVKTRDNREKENTDTADESPKTENKGKQYGKYDKRGKKKIKNKNVQTEQPEKVGSVNADGVKNQPKPTQNTDNVRTAVKNSETQNRNSDGEPDTKKTAAENGKKRNDRRFNRHGKKGGGKPSASADGEKGGNNQNAKKTQNRQ